MRNPCSSSESRLAIREQPVVTVFMQKPPTANQLVSRPSGLLGCMDCFGLLYFVLKIGEPPASAVTVT
jgi:hypothetical protein